MPYQESHSTIRRRFGHGQPESILTECHHQCIRCSQVRTAMCRFVADTNSSRRSWTILHGESINEFCYSCLQLMHCFFCAMCGRDFWCDCEADMTSGDGGGHPQCDGCEEEQRLERTIEASMPDEPADDRNEEEPDDQDEEEEEEDPDSGEEYARNGSQEETED